MKIALVGGTGSFGTALAVRLHAAGYDVVIGSRDAARARGAAAEIGGAGGSVEGATNEDAVRLPISSSSRPRPTARSRPRAR